MGEREVSSSHVRALPRVVFDDAVRRMNGRRACETISRRGHASAQSANEEGRVWFSETLRRIWELWGYQPSQELVQFYGSFDKYFS